MAVAPRPLVDELRGGIGAEQAYMETCKLGDTTTLDQFVMLVSIRFCVFYLFLCVHYLSFV